MMTPFPILISSMVRFVVNIAGARFLCSSNHTSHGISRMYMSPRGMVGKFNTGRFVAIHYLVRFPLLTRHFLVSPYPITPVSSSRQSNADRFPR